MCQAYRLITVPKYYLVVLIDEIDSMIPKHQGTMYEQTNGRCEQRCMQLN